jgi:hypothetical protein
MTLCCPWPRSSAWLALALLATTAAQADTPSSPTEPSIHEHRAACVAALTTKAEPLAARLKTGDATVETELLGLTESGFALIGAAYRDGLRKPEADQLLDAAKKAQKALPAPELGKMQASCQTEGSQVLADSNALERFLVTSAARRRVSRIAEAHK